MAIKIAFIGAGSIGFTRKLLSDILTVPEFHDIEVSFTDINPHNLDMVYQLCQRDIDANGLDIKIHATLDRREAFKGANYVVNCVRIGMLEAFQKDVEIPLKYGVDQCVGDTLCAGGIMYGQRDIAALEGFCRDIREVAAPGCMMLNYSNPNAMVTWYCNKYGGVPTVGLCHGVQGGHHLIAKALGYEQKDIDIICAGINHMTWYISVKHNGEELNGKLLAALEADPEIAQTEKVRIDMMKRFGYFSTESNGHLSEYVPWYRKRTDEIKDWIDLGVWINGETGGYLRVCTEGRNWFETDFPNWMKEPPMKFVPEERSPGARQLHHRVAGDRPPVPWPLQRRQPRLHNQPARGLHSRGAGLRRHPRHQHTAHRRTTDGLRRRVPEQYHRATPGRRGRSARRHNAAAPGHDDGPAGRRGLQSARDMADGR